MSQSCLPLWSSLKKENPEVVSFIEEFTNYLRTKTIDQLMRPLYNLFRQILLLLQNVESNIFLIPQFSTKNVANPTKNVVDMVMLLMFQYNFGDVIKRSKFHQVGGYDDDIQQCFNEVTGSEFNGFDCDRQIEKSKTYLWHFITDVAHIFEFHEIFASVLLRSNDGYIQSSYYDSGYCVYYYLDERKYKRDRTQLIDCTLTRFLTLVESIVRADNISVIIRVLTLIRQTCKSTLSHVVNEYMSGLYTIHDLYVTEDYDHEIYDDGTLQCALDDIVNVVFDRVYTHGLDNFRQLHLQRICDKYEVSEHLYEYICGYFLSKEVVIFANFVQHVLVRR